MRLTARWAIGWMLLTACAAGASAQISLASAVGLALKNDPRVKMDEASVRKAAAELNETRDVYIPTLEIDGGYGNGIGVPTALPTVFSLSSNSLVFNFSQRDNIRAAAAGLTSAKAALNDMREQVEEDVAVTYLNLDSDDRELAAVSGEFGNASRLVTIVQDRFDAGTDTRMDLLKAQRTELQMQLNQMSLQDEIAQLSDHLSRLIGLSNGHMTAISSSIPPLPSVTAVADSGNQGDSMGLLAEEAAARSKQELAFGQSRYRLRPQFSLGLNYTRIDTAQNEYTTYYPGFEGKSENAVTVALSITIPLFDHKHEDEAKEARDEASRAFFETESQRNQFLEGREKLRRSATELQARSNLAKIDQQIAMENLKAVLAELSADYGSSSQPQMTPEDAQRAKLSVGQNTVDWLNAQFQLNQAKVNLLRQTGQLEAWLRGAIGLGDRAPQGAVSH